jgi:hypothetical protein
VGGYKLTGANGDVIIFDNTNYVLNPTLNGFGIPPTSVRIDESSRDGGVFRNSRKAVRNIDMPVTVVGSDAVDVETKLRRLSRLVQDQLGPTVLTAIRFDEDENPADLTMELHYVGGAELSYGESSGGREWAKLLLSFQAPQPYWESAVSESFTVASGQTGRGLLPQLSKLKLSSSQALGVITVDNTSDVPVFPVYEIVGPVTNLRVSNGVDAWEIDGAIVEGDLLVVDTEAGTVTGIGGVNRYALLKPAPKLFPFQPGLSTINVEGIDANINTLITCSYNLRFEVVHG